MAGSNHPPRTVIPATTSLHASTLNHHHFSAFLCQQVPPISSHSVIKQKKKSNHLSIQQTLFNSAPLVNSSLLRHSEPHTIDYADLLKLSVRKGDVDITTIVHAAVVKLEEDTQMSNALIFAYLKLGLVNHAHHVFDSIIHPDIKSYSALISGLAKFNREREAMELFFEMRSSGIEPNEYSFVALLTACIRSHKLELGLQVHALVMKMGYLGCIHVFNALMGLYSKCGSLDFVIELFDNSLSKRDTVSWNTVISSMVKESMFDRTFEMFSDMQKNDSLRVDCITLSTLLTACFECSAVSKGQELHAHALRIGYEGNMSVNNALIKFYTRCGNINNVMDLFEMMPVKDVFTWNEMITAYMRSGLVDSAEKLFNQLPEKNVVLYNALLAGFCQNGEGLKAVDLFCRMIEKTLELSSFTLASLANACGLIMERDLSEQIHGFILKSGLGSNNLHVQSALLNMCIRCERMEDAEKIFCTMPKEHDKFDLTSMICGYAQNRKPEEAISLFCEMMLSLVIDEVASATVLGVCGTLGLHNLGKNLHCYSMKSGFMGDVTVGNAIISMYAKCGELGDAVKGFQLMSTRNLVSWNSLLAGYALHRQGDEALDTWAQMETLGIAPDSFTCLLVLRAYRYTTKNLVNTCQSFFFSIESAYGVIPGSDHYACLVSVLGHWGALVEAEEIIKRMPFEPDASVWRALLDSCRIHSNLTIGRRVMKKLFCIEPHDPSTFILKSNLYSASGRWKCSETVREEMKGKGFQKIPGRSWINHDNRLNFFLARDKSHSQSKDIYSGLEILLLECMKAGYVPDTSYVLHEVEEYQKKNFLLYHSSKLAVTYGLLMSKPGTPVPVMKNILLCGDCHTFFKFASIVTKREIRVRDSSGFHLFLNGNCSCDDRW